MHRDNSARCHLVCTVLAAIAIVCEAATGPSLSGLKGTSSTKGGTYIRLYGNGFGATAPQGGALVASIGNTQCSKVKWSSNTAIKCMIAPGFGAHLPVKLQVGSTKSMLPAAFSYSAPAVNSLIPLRGLIAGDEMISVTGDGFGYTDSSPVIYLGSTACRTSTWVTNTALKCLSRHASKPGPVAVRVDIQKNSGSRTTAFNFYVAQVWGNIDFSQALSILARWNIKPADISSALPAASGPWLQTHLGFVVDGNATASWMAAHKLSPSSIALVSKIRDFIDTTRQQNLAAGKQSVASTSGKATTGNAGNAPGTPGVAGKSAGNTGVNAPPAAGAPGAATAATRSPNGKVASATGAPGAAGNVAGHAIGKSPQVPSAHSGAGGSASTVAGKAASPNSATGTAGGAPTGAGKATHASVSPGSSSKATTSSQTSASNNGHSRSAAPVPGENGRLGCSPNVLGDCNKNVRHGPQQMTSTGGQPVSAEENGPGAGLVAQFFCCHRNVAPFWVMFWVTALVALVGIGFASGYRVLHLGEEFRSETGLAGPAAQYQQL